MKTTLQIKGMHCASCAVSIQKDLVKVPGVKEVSVNYANQKGYVEFDENKTGINDLIKSVRDTGYDATSESNEKPGGMHQMPDGEMMSDMDHTEHAQAESKSEVKKKRNNLLLAAILTIPIVILSFFADVPKENEIMLLL